MKQKLTKLKWWGIDGDSTLWESKYNPKTNKWDFLEPTEGVREALQEIHQLGKKIVIYTSRPWTEYIEIEEFMNKHKLPFDLIVCGKLLVEMMIDDRATNFDGNWEQTIHNAQVNILRKELFDGKKRHPKRLR